MFDGQFADSFREPHGRVGLGRRQPAFGQAGSHGVEHGGGRRLIWRSRAARGVGGGQGGAHRVKQCPPRLPIGERLPQELGADLGRRNCQLPLVVAKPARPVE